MERRYPDRRRLSPAAFVLAFAVLAGCRQSVDLSAVRTMSKGADDARASYHELAADYFDSCLRRAQLKSIGRALRNDLAVPPQPAARTPAPNPAPPRGPRAVRAAATPAPVYPPELAPAALRTAKLDDLKRLTPEQINAFDDRQAQAIVERSDIVDLERAFGPAQQQALAGAVGTIGANVLSCAGANRVADQWRRRDDVLVGYFAALGRLAGGAGDDDRYGIAGLADSLQTTGEFSNPKQTDAFKKLANDVLRTVFDWKRRDALADDLAKGMPLVDDIVTQLSSVASVNYRLQLRREREALTEFRDTNLLYAQRGAQAFEVYQYAKSLNADFAALDAREAAADAYVASLGKLKKAHDAVVTAVKKNDVASGVAAAKLYYDDLHADVQTVHKAFSGGK